jgi:hypothetical protein
MNPVRRHPAIDRPDDDEAAVLCPGFGKPVPATGIDLAAAVILRPHEQAGQVVGPTRVGLRRALATERVEEGQPAGIGR